MIKRSFNVSCAMLLCVGLSVDAVATSSSRHSDGRDSVRLMWNIEAPSMAGDDEVATARDFLSAHADDFDLADGLGGLTLLGVRESLLAKHVSFQQTIAGVPVSRAQIVVSVSRRDGGVLRVFNNTYPVVNPPPQRKSLVSSGDALDVAWSHLRVHGEIFSEPKATLVYVPEGGSFRLAYRTQIGTRAPRGEWEHTIDAVTGEIIKVTDLRFSKVPRPERTLADFTATFAAYDGDVRDREASVSAYAAKVAPLAIEPPVTVLASGTAQIFDPDPKTTLADDGLLDGSSASSFTPAYLTRALRDITSSGGTHSLVGPYVRIVDWDAPADAPSTSASGNWTAPRGNNDFNDAMTYYHIDNNQRYLQSLGFTGDKAIQGGSIEVDSNGEDGADNSAYYGGANRMSFGHGGVDDNEDADVILHEYWHAVRYDINANWVGGDTGAMGEGFGDYWAASYSYSTSNGPTYHVERVFTWDGHNAYWPGRDLDDLSTRYDPTQSYPAHTVVNGDDGDELWGTPVFQAFLELVRRGIPRTEVDTIVVESQFGLGSGVTMRDMAQVIVQTANVLYPQGPHAGVFANKFAHHNILDSSLYVSAPTLSAEPVATPGTSNQLAWTGGSIPDAKRAVSSVSTHETVCDAVAVRRGVAVAMPVAAVAKTISPAPLSGVVYASDGPVVTAGWVPVKSDGFEGTWPGDWQTWGNYESEGTTITWGRTTYVNRDGSYSAGSQCSAIDPAESWPFVALAGGDDIECWMWYGPFDLSAATDARVVFYSQHEMGSGDTFSWMASTDDVDYYGTTLTGGDAWGRCTKRTFDLTSVPTLGNLAGQSTVYVAFKVTWDSVTNYVDGPFIDDVLIEQYTSGDFADLEVQSMTLPPGSVGEFNMMTVTVQVANGGLAAAAASYAELYVSPANDTDTSDDFAAGEVAVPALSASASTSVTWTVRVPNLNTGDYPVWLVATLDPRSNVPESDESDNTYKHSTSVPVTGATVFYNCLIDTDPTFGSPSDSGWVAQQDFVFDDLLPGTQYWYRVRAGAGPFADMVESEWSNTESSTQNLPMGTPVWWMRQNGLTNGELTDLELADVDHDGMQAWEEWFAFTDPTNQASALTFTDSASSAGDRVVWWRSVAGPTYSLLRGTNAGGPFSPVATGLSPTPPLNVWTDSTSTATMDFYRIVVDP
ncbi:MAG: hypothetical protein K9N51_12450 [Candidatus Pacebacteria bacterium]|nr:hypothetical protein [Candidatus Paceibacterota bacterium]